MRACGAWGHRYRELKSCLEFWRTFVRSSEVMDYIEAGYKLLWTLAAPERKEMNNAPSAWVVTANLLRMTIQQTI